ncbi:aconitase X [Pseudomonadota bacterium]
MILEPIDQQLLSGELGPAARRAMQILHQYALVVDAKRFVSIESAHIDSCLYHGPSGLDFVNSFLDLGGRVRVPATLNVAAIDLVHPEYSQASSSLTEAQRAMARAYTDLGCQPTLTCAPYHRKQRPKRGQHIAWAESNAIVFANSCLGARTDRYGDFTDLCAALTGRVPLAGLHLAENRLATFVLDTVDLHSSGLERDLYFACLGYFLGAVAGTRVAVIQGAPVDTSEDELKALGAAAASSGAVAMFHMIGVTPEADTLEQATGENANRVETIRVDSAQLNAILDQLCPVEPGEPVAALCAGTPHFSLQEFKHLAERVRGRKARQSVDVFISTSRETAGQLDSADWADQLWEFGVKIIVDTCTYLTPVVLRGEGIIVTNSAKWAHYAPGTINSRSALMSMERCIRCAEQGKIVR